MKVTGVRIKLVNNRDNRLKAFCSITLDRQFVVRDIKIIKGGTGYFVAMPSRKMSDHCDHCGSKNNLQARYCNVCGGPLTADRAQVDPAGRVRLYADIAHPVTPVCRKRIEEAVLAAFARELQRSQQPGYVPPDLDEPDDDVPEGP